MPSEIIEDARYGKILVKYYVSSRCIRVRASGGQLVVTTHPHASRDRILEAVGLFMAKYSDALNRQKRPPIGPGYRLEHEYYTVSVAEGSHRDACFRVSRSGQATTLLCPAGFDCQSPEGQTALRNAVRMVLRGYAQRLLPVMLREEAARWGFKVTGVSISSATRKWGCCSSAGRITLSCYMMLLPPELMRFVILHELCHTVEMNHGERFKALLDKVSGGNRARMEAALRKFTPEV